MNSKWNHGNSIPVESLNPMELREAISEWAEDSTSLEKLLWDCHNNGILTTGCHDGNNNFPGYLGVNLIESSRESLIRMVETALNFEQSEIFIMSISNPYSGPKWYMPVLTFGLKTHGLENELWQLLSLALNGISHLGNQERNVSNCIFQITDFLTKKISNLNLRIAHSNSEKYLLKFECLLSQGNWEPLTGMFSKMGMNTKILNERFVEWSIEFENFSEFEISLEKILRQMEEKWPIAIPKEITSDMSLSYCALIMRNKYGSDEKGKELMNQWLNHKKPSFVHEVNY